MKEKYINKISPEMGKKVIAAGLGVLILVQMGVILYVNLFQMRYHLGYDVSSYMMKAIEVWRQKSCYRTAIW